MDLLIFMGVGIVVLWPIAAALGAYNRHRARATGRPVECVENGCGDRNGHQAKCSQAVAARRDKALATSKSNVSLLMDPVRKLSDNSLVTLGYGLRTDSMTASLPPSGADAHLVSGVMGAPFPLPDIPLNDYCIAIGRVQRERGLVERLG